MNIKEMTDEELLNFVLEALAERIEFTSGFITDPQTGYATHQVLRLVCGDLATLSQPQEMDSPMQVVEPALTGETVN